MSATERCPVNVTNARGEWVRCKLPRGHAQRDCEPQQTLDDCCIRYLAHSLDLIAEWADAIESDPFPGMADAYRSSIKTLSDLCAPIARGAPCPWHASGIPEGYLAVMELTAEQTAELVAGEIYVAPRLEVQHNRDGTTQVIFGEW